jgi:hypothetical protein
MNKDFQSSWLDFPTRWKNYATLSSIDSPIKAYVIFIVVEIDPKHNTTIFYVLNP